MPDIVVRDINEAMADRIKTLARERRWSINDVILHALRYGLGLGGEAMAEREFRDIARLAGAWGAEETAAFEEALEALASAPEGQLARS